VNYETSQSIIRALDVGARIESAIWLGSLFAWAIVFWMLYQKYRLRFLKLLLISEFLWVAHWFWFHRHFWFGHPAPPDDGEAAITHMVIFSVLDFGFRFVPLLLSTIGACMAVQHLQYKSQEAKEISQTDAS